MEFKDKVLFISVYNLLLMRGSREKMSAIPRIQLSPESERFVISYETLSYPYLRIAFGN